MAIKKRILVTGPIFDTQSGPSGQGGKLYTALTNEGYTTFKRSNKRNRLLRLVDTLGFVLFNFSKYDAVIVQVFSNKAFVLESCVILLNRILGKKIIAVIRGGAFPEFTNKYPKFIRFVLSKCYHVETPSKYIIEELKKHNIKVGYTPNFIDPSYFPYKWKNPSKPKLLWVRAFHKIYNPDIAIRCVAALIHKYPEIRLTMVGPDQGELKNIQLLIKELNLTNYIDIVGPQPNHELAKYYTTHTVFITTTSYESFGVAMVEAANCGIPMVATKVGEIPFMWQEEKEILLAELLNQDLFNKKVETVLSNEELAKSLSINARKKATQYSWSFVNERWNQLINV
ncbi:MAG: glycosyltransferase family 4 protein [Bacteroidia bacterium]|nr:glycosyltransferase family 4 protein [Bacteroidia bacterium]MBP9688507.1 glycosyltransferase family 4 protein [Bacteroidia bacterium]